MDASKLRRITNNYQDVRLISLRNWKRAPDVQPRDHAGPYVISQQGFDPQDLSPDFTDFLLSKSGEWAPLSVFFSLNEDFRRDQFLFGTAAEVMELMVRLSDAVRIIRASSADAPVPQPSGDDDLGSALLDSRERYTLGSQPLR